MPTNPKIKPLTSLYCDETSGKWRKENKRVRFWTDVLDALAHKKIAVREDGRPHQARSFRFAAVLSSLKIAARWAP
jgi:hypothetical protein